MRAACESLAYQTYDIAEAMFGDGTSQLSSLEVDGGGSRNDFIMQFQADLLEANVVRCSVGETTALGAAYIAGLARGVWSSREELSALRSIERTFEPEMEEGERSRLIAGWRRAVERALS